MREGRSSHTAAHNALFRALETRRSPAERVADDPLAVRFLPRRYRVLAEVARVGVLHRLIEQTIDDRWPCARGGVVARTRLIDEQMSAAVAGVSQVLILGAGFDTRGHRLPGLAAVPVFEVDHPDTQTAKRRALKRTPPGGKDIRYVAVVFGQDDLASSLIAAGFRPAESTLVLWEGVTNYLDAKSMDATFRTLAQALGPSSPVLFTYVHRGMLDGSVRFDGAGTTMRAVRRAGEPFTFGFDPDQLPGYLAQRGFELEYDSTVEDAGAAYFANGQAPRLPAYYHLARARRAER
jgi:methyltransferase (TIGR00027 family)